MPGLSAKAREFLKTHILRKPKRRTVAATPRDGGLPPNGVQGPVVSTPLSTAEHRMRPTASDATSGTDVDYREWAPVLRSRREDALIVNQPIRNNAYSEELRSNAQPAVSNAEVVTTAPTAAVVSPSPGDNYHNLEEKSIDADTVAPGAPPHPEHPGRANVPDVSGTPSIYDDFVALRQRVDRRLAHLRTFWSVSDWEELFASAVEGVKESDDARTHEAIIALAELDRKLSDADEAHKAEEAEVRLSSLEAALYPVPPLTPKNPKTPPPNEKGSDFWMLDEEAAKSFRDRYDAIRNEVRPNAAPPLEAIRTLQKDLDDVLARRRHFLSSQMVRMDVLKPLFDRAMSIADRGGDHGAKEELSVAWAKIASKVVKAEERDQKLDQLTALATKIIKARPKAQLLDEQKRRLPIHPSRLREGDRLGSGNFGDVTTLLGSDHPPLVGKRPNNTDGEIEHEEAVYAQLGEHPNIAKCYGIHAIGGKEMLVMENVQGGDITEVLEGLRRRYRDIAREREVVDPDDSERKRRIVAPVRKDPISRAEYLGSVQQILKGILQGLAHFESLGLVHRDVKGDNIRFDPLTLQPKLVDMGLAQQEGPRDDKPHATRITAPENFLPRSSEEEPNPTVTPVWDAFSVSKVLFPLLEQETPHAAKREPAEIYQFLTGNPKPERANLYKGIYVTAESNLEVARLAASAMERDPATRQVTAKREPDGNPAWQALNPAPTPGTAAPGLYGVMTSYVDFMNGLSHPDPAKRLSPIEALQHPFMTERLIEESQLAKVLERRPDFLPRETEPAHTAYADPLPPNPTLYFRLNSQSGFNYRVDSRNPGSPWARVEQFCAYLAAEWISIGCPAQGLRFDGLPSRQDAVDSVIQWAGKGGLGAQAEFAARRIGGQKVPSVTVLNDVRLKRYGPGTVLWLGTDAHTWAAAVQPDGSYLIYDPNTGKTEVWTPARFATNEHGANLFVVRIVASMGNPDSTPDSPPAAPAPSPQANGARTAIEFAISTVRAAYDRDASLLGGNFSAQLQETGKARGSKLQGVVDTMSRVENLHAEILTAPTKYAAFKAAIQELRSQVEQYLLEHARPVSSDGKARKKACETIGKCVTTLEASLKTARDQVEIATELVRKLPFDERGSSLFEAYNNLLAQPYTPADIREDQTKLL